MDYIYYIIFLIIFLTLSMLKTGQSVISAKTRILKMTLLLHILGESVKKAITGGIQA